MKKKLTDFESYSENPSKVLEKDLKLVKYNNGGDVFEMANEATGEAVRFQTLGNEDTMVVDDKEYRKLYVEELDNIKELTTAGLKVLCYVLKYIGIKKDSLIIPLHDCMEFTGYGSRVAVYNGIIDLLDRGILYRKVGSGAYFININAFYSGNRINSKKRKKKNIYGRN